MTGDGGESGPAGGMPERIPAIDRTSTAARDLARTAQSVRPPRRRQRIAGVLSRRQPTLTLVLEDVHDPHNASAVLRSCDATGVLGIHLVYVNDPVPSQAINPATSGSSAKWVDVTIHDSLDACYRLLHAQGFQILALALGPDAGSLYEADLTRPTALAFGNEQRGVSAAAIEGADGIIEIPMQGMVESLNISVACAVTLYEAMRQRRAAGMYDAPQLDAQRAAKLEQDWLGR